MRVLVTGGAGFIGSHIVEHFQNKAEVVVLDNLRSGYLKNIEKFDVKFINDSVLNRTAVREAMQGVDYVFHLAAMISVPESMINPIECVNLNNGGTLIVLEEAVKAKVKKLCFSTSAAIYGDNPEVPKRETMFPEPQSPYAVSKLDGEYYCDIFAKSNNLKTSCLRYFNVFGPRQDPKSAYAAAVPIFTSKAIANETINIFGDGEQTKDIVAANVYFAMNDYTGVYNVAYGKKITINNLIEMIKELTNSNSNVVYNPERLGDVKHSMASIEKLISCGFSPTSNFKDGLDKTIEYFRNK